MRKTILSGLIAAALLVALLNLPVLAQVTNFTSVTLSGDLVVGDDATVADALSAADVTASDDLVVGDDSVFGGFVRFTPGSEIVVTSGSTITPVTSYVPITGSTGVGTSSIAVMPAGTAIYVVNMANTTITLTDTGALKLSGNAALSQYDNVTLVSDGTNWIEISETNN